MVNVYIKERINDQTTICAGGVTGNTTYLGVRCINPLYEASAGASHMERSGGEPLPDVYRFLVHPCRFLVHR